jgi:hypothetical protein
LDPTRLVAAFVAAFFLAFLPAVAEATPVKAKPACVFNIRGYFGFLVSGGLPALTAKMRAQGIEAHTVDHGFLFRGSFTHTITNAAIAAHNRGCRIVLVGHSFGGDTAAYVADALRAKGIKVELLAAIDPTNLHFPAGGPFVPSNVGAAMGFHQEVDMLGRGQLRRGKGFKGPLTQERRDQAHGWMDNDPVIHNKIIARIKGRK